MKASFKRKYFEIWGDEQSQNSILKGLLVFFITINVTLVITITVLATQKPSLISMGNYKTNILIPSQIMPKEFIQQEIKHSLSHFMKLKHNWSYKNIDKNLKEATDFIEKNSRSKFLKANQSNIKTAKEKKIIQKFYISSPILIDTKKQQAQVTGDRILIVEGLRATQPMTFKINYQFGKRTSQNPEGIYITNETLVDSLRN